MEFDTYYEAWQRWFTMRAYPRDVREITAQKSAAKALAESEERYRFPVLATSTFGWTADPAGEFTTPPPAWTAYTGQTFEEYGGSEWISAVHPDDRERVAESWRAAVAAKSIYEVERRAWHVASASWRISKPVAFQFSDTTAKSANGSPP